MRKSLATVLLIVLMFAIEPICLGEETSPGGKQKGPIFGGPQSLELISGYFLSPLFGKKDRVDIDYVQADVRLGWLFHPEKKSGAEVVLDLTNSAVTKGPGNYMGGFALLLRYNWLLQDWVRPYVHVGAGIIYNDIYKDETQTVMGQAIEFTLRGGVGFKFKIHPSWSLDLEGSYEHVSNAGLADRNMGLNAIGGMLGVTYYFAGF